MSKGVRPGLGARIVEHREMDKLFALQTLERSNAMSANNPLDRPPHWWTAGGAGRVQRDKLDRTIRLDQQWGRYLFCFILGFAAGFAIAAGAV